MSGSYTDAEEQAVRRRHTPDHQSPSLGITILPVTEDAARDAGVRIGQTAKKNVTVDAMIVAVAIAYGAYEIITSDPAEIAPLAATDLSVVAL